MGGDNTGGVVGNTDLSTCCEVLIRGLVYISLMELRLPLSSDSVPIGEGRGAQIVVIYRTTAMDQLVSRCTMMIIDNMSVRATVRGVRHGLSQCTDF